MTDVKKKAEDEWFAKHERDLIEELRRERKRRELQLSEATKQGEQKQQKELHWMKCPKCGSDLQEQEIVGIKIDKCPNCEGIFLDRGAAWLAHG